jgi:Ca2+-binding RTX toxin-like protein
LALDASTDSGKVGDGITKIAKVMLDGSAEAGASVSIYDGAAVIGTGTADPSGKFSIAATSPLSEGAHDLIATAADLAGNVGPASARLHVVVDTTAPVTAITDVTQTSTTTRGVTTTSTVVHGHSESGSAVTLSDTVGTTTSVLNSAIVADASGNWSYAVTNLSNVVHSFTASATDVAGNVGAPGNIALFGTIGFDWLKGGAGNDVLIGQKGIDLMTGGLGSDTFVFHLQSDLNAITDFDPAHDALAIDHAMLPGSANVTNDATLAAYLQSHAVDLSATIAGQHLQGVYLPIDAQGDAVLLAGVTKAQLTTSDFHLI